MQKVPKYLIAMLAAVVGLLFLWYFRTIVIYIIIAAVLGIIGRPLVNIIRRVHIKNFRIPDWLAGLVTLLVIWGVAVTFFSLFIPLIFNKITILASLDVTSALNSFQEPISRFEEFLHQYFAVDTEKFSITGSLANWISGLLDWNVLNNFFGSIISVAASTVIALFSVTFMAFFFLKDDNLFLRILLAITPTKYEENIKHALSSSTRLLSRYLLGILAESTIVMLIVSVGLMIWGFSAADAFFMGIIVGVLNVIPYVGPWLGFGICLLVGGFIPTDMTFLTVFLAIGSSVIAAQATDNLVLQPVLYSNSVNAHPLEIFIVLLMAGQIGGVIGMIVAIPAYTVLRVIAKEFFFNFKLVQKLTQNM